MDTQLAAYLQGFSHESISPCDFHLRDVWNKKEIGSADTLGDAIDMAIAYLKNDRPFLQEPTDWIRLATNEKGIYYDVGLYNRHCNPRNHVHIFPTKGLTE